MTLKYEWGQGVPKDYNEAVKWHGRAAQQGYAKAQSCLGYAYWTGRGISQDAGDEGVEHHYGEAVWWWRKAAEQGYAIAQVNLGHCYYNGQGVHRDYVLAYKWYLLAVVHGSREKQTAEAQLGDIERKITFQQVAEARQLARKWKALEEMPSKFEQMLAELVAHIRTRGDFSIQETPHSEIHGTF